MTFAEIVDRLDRANLNAETYRTAVRLYRRADPVTGSVRLERGDLCALAATTSEDTARVRLQQLKAAGILEDYKRNGHAQVWFANWQSQPDPASGDRLQRTERDHQAINLITGRSPEAEPQPDEPPSSDHQAINLITGRSPEAEPQPDEPPSSDHHVIKSRATRANRAPGDQLPHTHARARSGWLVGTDHPPHAEEPTNQPASPKRPKPPKRKTWEAPLSYRLLTDKRVGVTPKNAERLSQAASFAQVRAAVAHWHTHRGSKFGDEPGIVVKWLDNPKDFAIPEPSAAYLHSALGQDYRTPDEVRADAEAEARLVQWEQERQQQAAAPLPDQSEQSDPLSNRPGSPPDDDFDPQAGFSPSAVWRQLQSEFANEQGGSFDRWVHDTWVISYDDGSGGGAAEFLIGLPDAFRYDWIVHRLSRQIKRKLAVILGQPTEVKFRVQPRPQGSSNP